MSQDRRQYKPTTMRVKTMDAALSTEHTSTIHNYPGDKFNLLNLEYPTGRYLKGDEFEWFELVIKDANKTITWFKDEK